MPTKQDAEEILKKVKDPEIGIDIFTLGLIYDINIKENDEIHILMTLTSPMCPFGDEILKQVKEGLTKVGFKNPNVEVTFDPVWAPSEELRAMLGV